MSTGNYTARTPWYGTWPPVIRKGDSMRSNGKIFLLPLVLLGVIIGILLIIIPSLAHLDGLWANIMEGLGIAFVTSAILGSTIEWFFRQRLLEDVFKASVGYILNDELKAEVGAIYNQQILCVKHTQEYNLLPVANNPDLVILHYKIQRDLKNIGNKDYSLEQVTSLFEWFHKELKSRVVELGCELKGKQYKDFTLRKITNRIEAQLNEKVIIPKDEKVILWYEIEEIKHVSDIHYEMFAFATIEPEITFHEPPKELSHLGINVSFGTREQKNFTKIGRDTLRLKGTMLPYQGIEVRWWNNKDAEQWQKNNNP